MDEAKPLERASPPVSGRRTTGSTTFLRASQHAGSDLAMVAMDNDSTVITAEILEQGPRRVPWTYREDVK